MQCIGVFRLLPRNCQMMFFSATYEEDVMEFAEGIVSDPVIIRLRREEESLHNIKQYYVMCRNLDEKYTAIANIYGVVTIGQAMIFCHVSCLMAVRLLPCQGSKVGSCYKSIQGIFFIVGLHTVEQITLLLHSGQ